MIKVKHWRSFPFLQALRPEPGEVVDSAVLTTYSADLVVVAASLLALAGELSKLNPAPLGCREPFRRNYPPVASCRPAPAIPAAVTRRRGGPP